MAEPIPAPVPMPAPAPAPTPQNVTGLPLPMIAVPAQPVGWAGLIAYLVGNPSAFATLVSFGAALIVAWMVTFEYPKQAELFRNELRLLREHDELRTEKLIRAIDRLSEMVTKR